MRYSDMSRFHMFSESPAGCRSTHFGPASPRVSTLRFSVADEPMSTCAVALPLNIPARSSSSNERLPWSMVQVVGSSVRPIACSVRRALRSRMVANAGNAKLRPACRRKTELRVKSAAWKRWPWEGLRIGSADRQRGSELEALATREHRGGGRRPAAGENGNTLALWLTKMTNSSLFHSSTSF